MIFGHDVSHHQPGVDVGRLAGRFIIARTAQAAGGQYGTTRDTMYATHKANARRAGKLFGAYFYLGSALSATANAALHASIEPDRSIPVMLDWEAGSGNVAFLRACHDAFAALGYHVFLTYAPGWYLSGAGGGGSLAGLPPLASSRYPDNTPGTIAAKFAQVPASYWNGYGGNTVAVLQFSSVGRDAAYPTTNLDCLAFNGTEDQLSALFGAATESAPPADDQEEDEMSGVTGAPTLEADSTKTGYWGYVQVPVNGKRYFRLATSYGALCTIDGITMIDDTPGPEGSNGVTVQAGGTFGPDRPGPLDLSKAHPSYANFSHVVVRYHCAGPIQVWINDRP